MAKMEHFGNMLKPRHFRLTMLLRNPTSSAETIHLLGKVVVVVPVTGLGDRKMIAITILAIPMATRRRSINDKMMQTGDFFLLFLFDL